MADGGNGGRRGLWCQPSCVKMHPGCKPCKYKRGAGLTSDIFPSGIFSFNDRHDLGIPTHTAVLYCTLLPRARKQNNNFTGVNDGILSMVEICIPETQEQNHPYFKNSKLLVEP